MFPESRMRRIARELTGRRQLPRAQPVVPRNFEEQLYAAIVQPGDTCLDIGANIGEVALFLARLAGPEGTVCAFEPVWPVYRQLCRNLQFDTFLKAPVITVQCALSDRVGQGTINLPGDDFGFGSLAPADNWRALKPDARVRSFRVDLDTLDGFLAAHPLAEPDFVKIDIEGAEGLLLAGAAGLLGAAKPPMLLMELFAPWQRAFGYGPWDVLSVLRHAGYEFLFACPQGLVPHAPTAAEPMPAAFVDGYNVIAYRPDLHAARAQRLETFHASRRPQLLPMGPPPQPNRVDAPPAPPVESN